MNVGISHIFIYMIDPNPDWQDIERKITSLLEEKRMYLFELSVKNVRNNPLIQLYVDTEEGVTANQLAEISRNISSLLDSIDNLNGKYRVDVSSPGISRSLQFLWQYKKNVGRTLRVEYEDQQLHEEFGQLLGVEEGGITLSLKKEIKHIPFSMIKKSEVQVSFTKM